MIIVHFSMVQGKIEELLWHTSGPTETGFGIIHRTTVLMEDGKEATLITTRKVHSVFDANALITGDSNESFILKRAA